MEKLRYKEHGTFTFKVGDSLSQKTKEIPNGYGVYRIYANSIKVNYFILEKEVQFIQMEVSINSH